MEEKGKTVTIETNDKEEDLQALVDEMEEVEDREKDIHLVHFASKLLEYVSLLKGKTKIPRIWMTPRAHSRPHPSLMELCLRART